MFIPHVRTRGPVTRERWLMLTVLAVAAAIVAGLQFTSAALLPPEKTAAISGVAVGLVIGSIALGIQRLRGE
ncbi:MAG TPA: hypothetical protein VF092_04100 [Longimicrobium sp.]